QVCPLPCQPATQNVSTAAALPVNRASPNDCIGTLPPRARCVVPSIRMPHPATLVCASSRAARFTVSPMQVYVARCWVPVYPATTSPVATDADCCFVGCAAFMVELLNQLEHFQPRRHGTAGTVVERARRAE